MKFETNVNVPETRLEFERVMNVIREMSEQGKLFLTEGLDNHGLDMVRALPNKRYNLLTINEGARLIANMSGNSELMRKKEVNIERKERNGQDERA